MESNNTNRRFLMKEIESKEEVKEFSPKPAQIRFASYYLNIEKKLNGIK